MFMANFLSFAYEICLYKKCIFVLSKHENILTCTHDNKNIL